MIWILRMLLLFLMLNVVPNQANAQFQVSYSSDASSSIDASSGNHYSLFGLSGSTVLQADTPTLVNVTKITYLDLDPPSDQSYQRDLTYTLQLNGTNMTFSQTWTINDSAAPTSELSAYGPVVYNVDGGTITATMVDSGPQSFPPPSRSGDGPLGSFLNGQVSLLFTPAVATPEPASMTLLATGIAGVACYGLRRRKQSLVG